MCVCVRAFVCLCVGVRQGGRPETHMPAHVRIHMYPPPHVYRGEDLKHREPGSCTHTHVSSSSRIQGGRPETHRAGLMLLKDLSIGHKVVLRLRVEGLGFSV